MQRSVGVLVLALMPVIMGATCNTRSALQEIRRVHVNVRDAFVLVDTVVSPMIEDAADRCIAEVRERGLDGDAGRDAAFECVRPWFRLEEVITSSRAIMAELENVYSTIESGDGNTEWQYWARQLILHGRGIVRILGQLHVDIPSGFVTTLDALCSLTQCEVDNPGGDEE